MFRLPALCCKLLHHLSPPHCFLGRILSRLLEMLPLGFMSEKFPQIKHSSQLLGCDYFLSQQWSINFQVMGKEECFQQKVLGQLESYMQKNEVDPPPNTIYKINSNWIIDIHWRDKTMKVLEEKMSESLPLHLTKLFLNTILATKDNRKKKTFKIKRKFLFKGYHEESEKLREDICKSCVW